MVLFQALKMRASDVHLYPYEDRLQVRQRIDGILYDTEVVPKKVQDAVISRVKIMGKMDIAERRLPQDGRATIKLGEGEVDVRISSVPTSQGERIVMRLLDMTARVLGMEQLGLDPDNLQSLRRFAHYTHGIILVTGPTGSGKTTTLASLLNLVNEEREEVHLITIEDPIEYYHKHKKALVTQREVGVDVPNFAEALRRALRQDPDMVLVGEMRDLETIEAAITAAETGHLVFGTLHTTGAAKTIDRLVNAFPVNQQEMIRIQLSTVLQCVVSQLLIPRIDKPGRVAIFEIMMNTPSIAALIRDNKTFRIQSDIQTGAKYGMVTLDSFLIEKYLAGMIAREEVITKSQDPISIQAKLQELELAQATGMENPPAA